jgi:osmotically-inducible protein OsmY
LHSQDAKDQAAQVAKSAARDRIIANEISVEPVGAESQAKKVESNLDDGIESNYKAALIASGLAKQDINYGAKNGALTLKGKVKARAQRQQAQEIASKIPNVTQVINEIEVRR